MKLYPKIETGSSNTRLDSQQIISELENSLKTQATELDNTNQLLTYRSIDYLTLTYRFESAEQAKEKLDFLAGYLDDVVNWHCEKPRDLGKWFEHTFKTVRGATVGWQVRKDDTVEAIAVLSGQVLGAATPSNLRRALLYLHQWYQNCSRIDLAYDNNSGMLSKLREQALASWKQGLNSGFKKLKIIQDGNSPTDMDTTHYWGSRNSPTLIRIYDKGNSTRFEIESKRGKSTSLYARYIELMQNEIEMEESLIHLFNAAIDGIEFYSERKNKNLGRNKIAEFWQDFRDTINYEKVVLPKLVNERSFEKSMAWLERSVASTLAMARQGMGSFYEQFHYELIEKGKEKMNSYKKLIAKRVRREENGMEQQREEMRREVYISEERLKEWDKKRMEENGREENGKE